MSPITNAAKTHCDHGHPLSGDNVRIDRRSNGRTRRVCRECERIRKAKSLDGPPRPPDPDPIDLMVRIRDRGGIVRWVAAS